MARTTRLLTLWLCAVAAWGAQSLTPPTGGVTSSNLPNAAPWNNFSSKSWNLTVRLHGLPAASQWTFTLIYLYLDRVNNFCTAGNALPGWGYGMSGDPQSVHFDCSATDIVIRLQADIGNSTGNCTAIGATNCAIVEVWTLPSLQYSSNVRALTGVTASLAGQSLGAVAGLDYAWAEWRSGAVPVGAGTTYCGASPTAACIPDLTDSIPGDLASYTFDGNLSDRSGNGLHMVNGGAPTYVATPMYAPQCNSGAQQVFQAGIPGVLAGSGLSLDGVTSGVSYLWNQLAGPPVVWSNQRMGAPTLTGLVATNIPTGPSSYVFQLTCTDSSGNTTASRVKDGAVATDSNGVVITGNSLLDQLIHNQLRLGSPKQPWPWEDNLRLAFGYNMIANIYNLANGSYPQVPNCTSTNSNTCWFQPWWKQYGAGTISVSDASNVITGMGTNFLTAYNCTAGGAPSNSLAMIAVEYLPPAAAGDPTKPHYRMWQVLTCTDATHLVIAGTWLGQLGSATGNYGVDNSSNAFQWGANSNADLPANFYDDVLAFRATYAATGIDDFLTAFRTFGWEWWEQPSMDQGLCFIENSGNNWPGLNYAWPGTGWCQGNAWRAHGELGLVLLALDRGDVAPNGMWAGLRHIWNFSDWILTYANHVNGPELGEREAAHMLEELVFCAQFDPTFVTPDLGNACLTDLHSVMINDAPKWADPATKGLYFLQNVWFAGIWDPNAGRLSSSISVSGTTVTCTDGSQGCNLNCGSGGPQGGQLWFLNPAYTDRSLTGGPQYNRDGDAVGYSIASVQDQHHLTLSTPYTGSYPTNAAYIGNCNSGTAYGSQPFMMSISGNSLDIANRFLATQGPAYSTDAANARTNSTYASQWLRNYAFDTTTLGTWYFRGYLDCPLTNTPRNGNCDNGDPISDPASGRILDAETVLAIQEEYAALGTPEAKTAVDTYMNAMFAKTGTCAGDPTCWSDGNWLTIVDWTIGPSAFGYFFGGGAAPWKWYGQFFGNSFVPAWPAVRQGGLQASASTMVYVPFNLSSVAGSTKVVVTRTGTDSSQASTTCTASPCGVSVPRMDNQQGVQLRLQYENAGGAILATSSTPVIVR